MKNSKNLLKKIILSIRGVEHDEKFDYKKIKSTFGREYIDIDGKSQTEYRQYTGEMDGGSYVYNYTTTDGKWIPVLGGLTGESEEEWYLTILAEKIESDTTINFDRKEYNSKQLKNLYDEIANTYDPPDWKRNELPDILNDNSLSDKEIQEVNNLKTKQEAAKWKSRIRSMRRKGKLEKTQINALNKLGMIWNPTTDKWEKNYMLFRRFGLCYEIKKWVKEQRLLFKQNKIPEENLIRLKAANFIFNTNQNEKYILTRSSCWDLRENLELKIKEEKKRFGLFEEEKPFQRTDKEKESQNKINNFYSRKFSFCHSKSINDLSIDEAQKELFDLRNGKSYRSKRLKFFLDNESKKYSIKKEEIPYYITSEYDEIKDEILTNEEIYFELRDFNNNLINKPVRIQACIHMLDFAYNRSLKETKFKEIDFLISTYKKDKNMSELIKLKDYIEKYPLISELYLVKISSIIK